MMKMKTPRFSLRAAMAGTAIAALVAALWARDMSARRRSYLESAAYHAGQEAEELRSIARLAEVQVRRIARLGVEDPRLLALEKVAHLRAAYHAESSRKFEIAAGSPWGAAPRIPDDPGVYLTRGAGFRRPRGWTYPPTAAEFLSRPLPPAPPILPEEVLYPPRWRAEHPSGSPSPVP